MKTEDALAIVEAFKSERPAVYRLALAASLAVRVEPELVRALRLDIVYEADAGAEADLWFSPLVQSQTPLALEFDPAVQELLRRRLAEDAELLSGAWQVVESFHAGAPYALRLEEELTWLGLVREDNRATIEERLGAALARLRSGREGLARWAARALPSLPPKARTTDAALVLSLAAGMRTGVGPVLEAVPVRVPEEGLLSEFTSGTLARVRIGVRLLRNERAAADEDAGGLESMATPEPPMQVELSYPPATGAAVFEVPDTYRLLLEISWEVEGGARRLRQLSLLPDERRRVPVEYGDVTIRTALGDLFVIRPRFDYDLLLLYYPDDERWALNLAERLSAQGRDDKPLRVATALFGPPFREFEELRYKFGLSRKVGLVVADAHAFAPFITQFEPSRPEPLGRGDWLICLMRGGNWISGHSARLVDFHTQSFDQAYRELWYAITGEDLPLTQEPVTESQTKPSGSVEIFYAYSYKDEALHDELTNHLAPYKESGLIKLGHDRRVSPGEGWAEVFDERLRASDIILPLVSKDFLASDYAYGVEMRMAMERHEAGEAFVIPIILRPCDWRSAPFGILDALPLDGIPVTDWKDRDNAFADIANGIRTIAEGLLASRQGTAAAAPAAAETSVSRFVPRPSAIGFVSRRDSQGRDIVARLKEELAPGRNQLVTISGPNGIGKTTLAAETARSLQEAYEHRVVWSSAEARTDFTLLSLLDDIATQLGRADLRTLAPSEKEEQVRVLAAGALVVLDNYETIAATERTRIETWFKRTPCSALFTSRPRVPDTVFIPVSAMAREEATEFLERLAAQTQAPQMFTPDVRARVYETAEADPYVMQWVMAQIDDMKEPATVFEELAGGVGDAAERVFARSFDLSRLGEEGQDVLLALTLFTPNASREALAAVAGLGEDWRRLDEAVGNLHALWLVKAVDSNRRLAVEGLTRSLAAARLSKDPRADEFRNRFVEYFLRYAEERREPTPENYDALEAERENLLGAAETAYTSGEWESVMRLAYALARPADGILSVRGYWDEAVRLGEQALQAAHAAMDQARIASFSHSVAIMYGNRGELAEARRLYEESLEINRRLGDQNGVAITLNQLGMLAQDAGEIAEARRLYEQSLEINRRLDDLSSVAITLNQLGGLAQDAGELGEARRLYEESLEINRRLGEQRGVAITLHQLGRLAPDAGEWDEARRLYEESLEISKRLGARHLVAVNLQGLSRIAGQVGDLKEAQRLLEESLAVYRTLGEQKGVAGVLHQMSLLALNQGDREEAVRLARESLGILERLGSPNAEIVRRTLAEMEGDAG